MKAAKKHPSEIAEGVKELGKVVKPATKRLLAFLEGKETDATMARQANCALTNFNKIVASSISNNRLKFQVVKHLFKDQKQLNDFIKVSTPLQLNK